MISHMEQRVNTLMPSVERRNRAISGLALVALGLVLLAVQLGSQGILRLFGLPVIVISDEMLDLLVVPALGLIFLLWGVATSKVGLLIPGCLLGAIGSALILLEGPLSWINGDAEASVFLFAMAASWVAVMALGTLLTGKFLAWPMIPAAIMGVIGAALLLGESGLHLFWPVALIVLGVVMLLRHLRAQA